MFVPLSLRWWQKYCREISLELMNPYENLLMKPSFSESFIVFFFFNFFHSWEISCGMSKKPMFFSNIPN